MLSVLTALVALAPQDPPRPSAFELVPLQHFTGMRTPVAPPPWGTMLRARPNGGDRVDLLHALDEETWFDLDHAASLLSSLQRGAVEDGKLSIEPRGTTLQLFGEEPLVTRAGKQARELGDLLGRPIELEFVLWRAPELTDIDPVLTPAGYTHLVANLTPVWRSLHTARHDGIACMDRQRWVRYVRAIGTEVAQKATIAQPVTDAFCDGGRVVVRPHFLASGDDLVLQVQFAFGAPRGPAVSMPSGLNNAPEIDQPTIASLFGGFSGRVRNGGALAVLATGHATAGDRMLLTVRATAPVPPPDTQAGEFGVFPVSALTNATLLTRCLPPSPYPLLGDDAPDLDVQEDEETYSRIDADRLQELLRVTLGELADHDAFSMHTAGGFLFVFGPRQAVTRIGELLRGFEQRLLRNAAVRHVGTLNDGERLHELVAATLLGRQLHLARLLETTHVRELHAEIAQEASILCPQVDITQSGTWLRLCATERDQTLHVEMMAQTTHVRPLPRRQVNPGGVLMPEDVASSRRLHDARVENGKAIDHGDGPVVTLDTGEQRSSAITTVKW